MGPAPRKLFLELLAAHGPRHWWPADDSFEMMVGAILVQNTAWTGAHQAVIRLKEAGRLSAAALRDTPEATLWELIRPAGHFRLKTRRLRALGAFLQEFDDDPGRLFQLDTAPLRQALLGVWGIGPETADSILCYEARRPCFVVDAYTRRLFSRLGWVGAKASYGEIQRLVEADLPADAAVLGEFHALIVAQAKAHCRARPVCAGCPVSGCGYSP
ncbi:MAG: endonuclease [Magnetococcales bacterium]|nr:endonuclease [Magnetococcales bacterium]